ncbi:MAG: cupin domain-containing protein [Methylobacteriaceae bacterium]|nr:cupin domain-containing protein [Methylobacteriaceae bacterium]
MQVRRVITGHDATGKSVISKDEIIQAIKRPVAHGVMGCEIWSSDRMPVDNSPAAEASQAAGFVKREPKNNNYVRTGGGNCMRIIEWSPGHASFAHRTETVDYIVILSGEIDLDLDEGETVHLKTGDVLIQRGGMHNWVNRGTEPAVMAAILIDATPVEVGGRVLRTEYPD